MAGRFYEDWKVGDRIEHELRRTVTETDNLLITALTHNPQPLHLDAEAASQSEFGRILVNGVFTFGLMIGVSVADTTQGVLIANLGYDQVVMPKPVFIGDTVTLDAAITEILPKHVAKINIIITKQTGEVVMDGKATVKLPGWLTKI